MSCVEGLSNMTHRERFISSADGDRVRFPSLKVVIILCYQPNDKVIVEDLD